MDEKQICCCGSSTWTKVIAWFQIIVSVLQVIAYAMGVATAVVVLAKADNAKDSTGKKLTPAEIDELKSSLTAVVVGTTVMLILSVLSFVMGIVLLRGTLNRNTQQIKAWLIYIIICIVIWTIKSITVSFAAPADALSNISTLLLGLVIQGFCVWVVVTHKKEIEASK